VSVLQKTLQILKFAILFMALLILLIIGAVNLPFVHTYLTGKTNSILEKNGIPIHAGKITLLLNGKIGITELSMILPPNDTIVYAGKLSVDIGPLQLLTKKVVINNLTLTNAVANILTDSISGNLQLKEVFNTTTNSVDEPETTETTNKWEIVVGTVRFKNIRFIYSDPQSGILVEQNLEKAKIEFDYFSLLNEQIDVENIEITKPEGMVAIWETTNISEEETDSETTWKFSLKNLEISNLLFELDQPDAGQRMKFSLKKGQVSLEKLDLATQEILVDKIKLDEPLITIVTSEKKTTTDKVEDELTGFSLPEIPWTTKLEKAEIKNGFFTTQSGDNSPDSSMDKWLPVNGLNANFSNISLTPSGYQLNLDKLSFSLAKTLEIESGNINFNSDSLENLELKAYFSAIINQNKTWPAKKTKMEFITDITGSTADIDIHKMSLQSSNGLQFNLSGQITQLMKMPDSGVNLKFISNAIARSQLAPVVRIFSPETELPRFQPVSISGIIKNSIMNPVLALKVNSKSGRIEANGNYSVKKTSGSLQASFTQILLSELMGETLPENISGKIFFKGGFAGSNLPEGEAVVQIDSLRYKNKTTRNIMVQVEAAENEADVTLLATDSAVNLDFTGHFAMNKSKGYSGNISGLFDVDLFAMNLMTEPFAGSGNIDFTFEYSKTNVTASTDLKNFTISNKNSDATFGDIQFNLNASDSLILSGFKSRFLTAEFNSRTSISDFKNAFESTQIENVINLDSASFLQLAAIQNLKNFKLKAIIHYDPVFNLFIPDSTLNFSDINIEIGKTANDSAMQGIITSEWISYNEIKSFNPRFYGIATNHLFTLDFKHDSLVGPQVKFGKAAVNVDVLPSVITTNFTVFDSTDSLLHRIGFEAKKENNLVILNSVTPEWIIDKNPWILSPPEFLTWDKQSKTLNSGMDLHFGNRHIGFKGKNTETLGLEIKNIELKNLAIPGIIGFVPDGLVDAKVIYTKTEHHNIELNMQMQQLKWEDVEFDLLQIEGSLTADSTGILNSELLLSADDSLSLQFEITSNNAEKEFHVKSIFKNLHFQLFEPFIDEYAKHLHGKSDGNIDLNVKSDKMTINGEIAFNNFGMKIIPLEAWLTIPDNKIEISENRFLFNNFTVIDSLNRPLTVNGKIVFENSDNIWADLMVKTDKILLMNTSESDNAAFFGSLLVNSALNISGSVFSPTIKGNIELDNGTNLTYQLIQDLSVQGSQTDVVFAVITDSLQVVYPETGQKQRTTQMPNIETTIGINSKSIFNVKISDIYGVDITIGGDGLLNYNMLPNNSMSLNGVYEIKTGDCKLKITGWPLKNFKITPGSSLRWDGSVENPDLNIEASTRVKGSYLNPIDNKSRAVDFIVSMQVKNKLSELAIQFAIQSPDQYITSVINSLSDDEIMRQAVNLLLFETIDIPGIESSGDYLSSQINSFWESQLNSLSRSTLKNTDLSFGIDTYNQSTSTGNQEKTSFTYEMEHRFMNDRATVRLSGKLNDYNEGTYKSNSIFENFIFEYALDSANTRNLKLYQKRDYEDMLEGEVIKYGVGFLYRKNYSKLKDIWQRGKKTKQAKKGNTDN
jgi:translocation and assembly module TamB